MDVIWNTPSKKLSFGLEISNQCFLIGIIQLPGHANTFWVSCLSNRSLSYKWVASILKQIRICPRHCVQGLISRRYPTKTITDADYTDDIAILANTPNQAETLLHSLEWAATGIGLYVNVHKTEYMCYNQTGDISTLDGTPLKLVDKFTYLGSSVASTEKDIDTRLTKAWTAIDRLSILWKSDLTD